MLKNFKGGELKICLISGVTCPDQRLLTDFILGISNLMRQSFYDTTGCDMWPVAFLSIAVLLYHLAVICDPVVPSSVVVLQYPSSCDMWPVVLSSIALLRYHLAVIGDLGFSHPAFRSTNFQPEPELLWCFGSGSRSHLGISCYKLKLASTRAFI